MQSAFPLVDLRSQSTVKSEPLSSPLRVPPLSSATPSRPLWLAPAAPGSLAEPPIVFLPHGDTQIECKLDELSDDATEIASVLRQGCSQAAHRDKWMIVASYYRGKGNHTAALMVVTTMVDGTQSLLVYARDLGSRAYSPHVSSCSTV